MPSLQTRLDRRLKSASRAVRGLRKIASALLSTDHPLLAHIIPIRRCNLACEYCNEYDDFSKPVPTEVMFQRVDKLGHLGTSVVTISGGGPPPSAGLGGVKARACQNSHVSGHDTKRNPLCPLASQPL